jgi:hypothetical protein
MEPGLLTQKQPGIGRGRPEYSNEQFKIWLEELRPHLELSNSIYRACQKSGLEDHYDVILNKYKTGDWFSRKVDLYRGKPGENANEAIVRIITIILSKAKIEENLTREEVDILKHFTDKHRTAQPFFVTRIETKEVDDSKVGKILDNIEAQTDQDKLAEDAQKALNDRQEASGQVVEANTPIQDQK